jgi:hypothetical protein
VSASPQKKHRCKVCDKRFTRPSSLQTHMYSHTGEKRTSRPISVTMPADPRASVRLRGSRLRTQLLRRVQPAPPPQGAQGRSRRRPRIRPRLARRLLDVPGLSPVPPVVIRFLFAGPRIDRLGPMYWYGIGYTAPIRLLGSTVLTVITSPSPFSSIIPLCVRSGFETVGLECSALGKRRDRRPRRQPVPMPGHTEAWSRGQCYDWVAGAGGTALRRERGVVQA